VTGRSTVKTTTNKRGKLVGVENKVKAWVTNRIEPWMVFSPRNKQAVIEAANRVLQESKSRMLVEKALGGRQI